ncbi:MAG: hypothetical protein LUI14_13885 [Lachnospiraceae bacterium]|nr:hypothetical protein [Lachnospiraceae bacterium]
MSDRNRKERIKDKIREETGKLKLLSWKDRLIYVWDYYKPQMAAIIAVIFVIYLGITIYHNLQIDNVFSVYMVNCNSYYVDSETLLADYTDYIGGIGEKEEMTFDTSIILDEEDSNYGYAYQMKFTAVLTAQMVDVILADTDTFEEYAGYGYFVDLREVLTDEQLEEWSDLLVYMDNTEEGVNAPYAIDLTGTAVVEEYDLYEGTVYGGVVINGENIDMAPTFLDWMFED